MANTFLLMLILLFPEFQSLFDETVQNSSALPWEKLHAAQIAHEVSNITSPSTSFNLFSQAVFITHVLTARFASASGKKKLLPVRLFLQGFNYLIKTFSR